MNRLIRWAFATALLPMSACSTGMPAAVMAVPPAPPPLAAADQAFMMEAAASDAAEIQSGTLAATKALNPRIARFAAKMVKDHTATTQTLTAIARAKGVTLSPVLTDAQQKLEAKLEADQPRLFDHDYIRGQVAAHADAMTVFQTEIDSGQDPDLKAFATATVPMIKQHLILAQRLAR